MKSSKKAVYFFCDDLDKDPVASSVFNCCKNLFNLKETDIIIDSNPVLEYVDSDSNLYQFVQTKEVLSHDYIHYLPLINKFFSNFDFAGIVNWHEGSNAPDRILTVHTTGDVPTGNFGKSSPLYFKNIINAIDVNRENLNLHEFTTFTEATHWSGTIYKGDPKLLLKYNVPMFDIEIGSSNESFKNQLAVKTLALSLIQVFDNTSFTYNLICVGGIHFEAAFRKIILNSKYPISIGHILPNQWIANEDYEGDLGIDKLDKCIKSVNGGVHGIVFHNKLKKVYKDQCRTIGENFKIPCFKHKLLEDMENVFSMLKAGNCRTKK